MSKDKSKASDYQNNQAKFAAKRKEINSLLSSLHANIVNNNLTEEQLADSKRKLDNLRKLAESLSASQVETVNKLIKELDELTAKFKAKQCIKFLEEKAELTAKIKKQLDNNEEIDYEEALNIYEEINEQLTNNAETYGLMTRNERNIADAILRNINEFYDHYNNAITTFQEEQETNIKNREESSFELQQAFIDEIISDTQAHPNSLASSLSNLNINETHSDEEHEIEEEPIKGPYKTEEEPNVFDDFLPTHQALLLELYRRQQIEERSYTNNPHLSNDEEFRGNNRPFYHEEWFPEEGSDDYVLVSTPLKEGDEFLL